MKETNLTRRERGERYRFRVGRRFRIELIVKKSLREGLEGLVQFRGRCWSIVVEWFTITM